MEFYKVYSDGSHYIATKKEVYTKFKRNPKRTKTALHHLFEALYLETIRDGLKESDRFAYIKNGFIDNFGDSDEFNEYIQVGIARKARNLHERKKRFRRKTFLNNWNYFVTLTYDDKKHTDTSFKKKLRKTLSNLHTRRGWNYMGVFEISPNDRVHFHALVYVPEGEMIGELVEVNDYDKRRGRIQTTIQNTFFNEVYGRSDFEEIDDFELRHGNTASYIIKYLGKTDARIVYSRGIPTHWEVELEDADIAVKVQGFIIRYILFDDVFDDEQRFKDEIRERLRM